MNKKSRLNGIKNVGQEGTLVDRIIDYIQQRSPKTVCEPIRKSERTRLPRNSRSVARRFGRRSEHWSETGLSNLFPEEELTSLRSRRKMPAKYFCCVLTSSAWLFVWQPRS